MVYQFTDVTFRLPQQPYNQTRVSAKNRALAVCSCVLTYKYTSILTEEHQLNMMNGAHENYSKILNECSLSISEGKLFENG